MGGLGTPGLACDVGAESVRLALIWAHGSGGDSRGTQPWVRARIAQRPASSGPHKEPEARPRRPARGPRGPAGTGTLAHWPRLHSPDTPARRRPRAPASRGAAVPSAVTRSTASPSAVCKAQSRGAPSPRGAGKHAAEPVTGAGELRGPRSADFGELRGSRVEQHPAPCTCCVTDASAKDSGLWLAHAGVRGGHPAGCPWPR